MEDRVAQFQEAAEKRLAGAPLAREIGTLRKFLYKNQEYRFTDREKTKLFTAVAAHWSNAAAIEPDKTGQSLISGLIDDCLKMPFTVFSTSQKSTMLKWHYALLGKPDAGDAAASGSSADPRAQRLHRFTVIDANTKDGYLSLLDDTTGETRDDIKCALGSDALKRISDALQAGKEVVVDVDLDARSGDAAVAAVAVSD
jgi:hypothetical protein